MAKRPTMPKSNPQAAAWFDTLPPHDTRVVIRPMFGHKAAFINGHMFAGTFGPDVFVRLDERSRAVLLTVEGTKPFEPMKGRPMVEYVQIPKRWLAEPPTAKSWIARSLEWAASLPLKVRTNNAKPGSHRSSRSRLTDVRKRAR